MTDVFYYGNAGGAPSANSQNQNGLDSSYSPLVTFPPPSRQRRSRTMFTDEDVRMLEDYFLRDPYPDIYGREELAAAIGVPEARIQTWFQNKRSRTRRRLNNQGQRSPPTASSPPSNNNNNNSIIKQEGVLCPLQSPLRPCMPSCGPVFQLQPPPSVPHGTSTPAAAPLYRQRSSPKLRISPVKVTPVKVAPANVAPAKVTPVKVTPAKVKCDADDSGILDLSIKSNDSPKDMAAKSTALDGSVSDRQASSTRMDPGTGRPFFTPWCTTPTYTAAGSFLPPAVVTSAAKLAAGEAVAIAAATASSLSAAAFPLPAQFCAQNPWLYGFTPSFNPKNGAYYFQPLPTSPFLHHVADAFPPSPGLTPLGVTPTGSDWGYLSPSLRSAPKHFLFPDVATSSSATSPPPSGKLQSPPCTPLSAATTTTADDAVLTPSHPPTKTEQGLSESPGSDAGSRSSGYSSRDSDIDVCN